MTATPRAAAAAIVLLAGVDVRAQAPSPHVLIPALANATHPSDLDFQAGECDVDRTGRIMDCRFQQVFLTSSAFDAETCLITTNQYERRFERDGSADRWVSRQMADGPCGPIEVTTLSRDGGARWTLDTETVLTSTTTPECRARAKSRETLSWRDTRRALPCRFVQPGAMSR